MRVGRARVWLCLCVLGAGACSGSAGSTTTEPALQSTTIVTTISTTTTTTRPTTTTTEPTTTTTSTTLVPPPQTPHPLYDDWQGWELSPEGDEWVFVGGDTGWYVDEAGDLIYDHPAHGRYMATSPTEAVWLPPGDNVPPDGFSLDPVSNDCTYDGIELWGSVYLVEQSILADIRIGTEESSIQADLDVYPVDSSIQAASCGLWYFVDSSLQADFTVRLVETVLPDLSIHFVDSSLQAGSR